jgi:hypothetical protein
MPAIADSAAISPPVILGNINPANDLYGSNPDCSNVDPLTATNALRQSYAWEATSTQGAPLSLILHYKITPAANGVDNQLIWTNYSALLPYSSSQRTIGTAGYNILLCSVIGGAAGASGLQINQSYIDISEYNSGFATSPTNDGPVFVNLAGTVVSV